MKKFNFQKGKLGEKIAADFLTKKRYRIVEENWQNRFGEIDLIATKKNFLIFVEVKLKMGQQFGSPEEMITPGKIWQIKKMAEIYLRQNPSMIQKYPQQRLDAVCITLTADQKVKKINHYQNLTG